MDDDRKSPQAYRTISEVASMIGIAPHILRFWETKFHLIRPMRRSGGRRFYRAEDIELLKRIHHLLHAEGYSIKGVQKIINRPSSVQKTSSNAVDTPTGIRIIEGTTHVPPTEKVLKKSSRDERLSDVAENLRSIKKLLKTLI